MSRLQSLTPIWKILEIAQQQSISLNQRLIFELMLLDLKFEQCKKLSKSAIGPILLDSEFWLETDDHCAGAVIVIYTMLNQKRDW